VLPTKVEGAARSGSAMRVSMLSNVGTWLFATDHSPSSFRTLTTGPRRSTSIEAGRNLMPDQMHSRLISGSSLKADSCGVGNPRSMQ
jgi:hypothetical protein